MINSYEPLLTIAIPTCNRASVLEHLLDSIGLQLLGLDLSLLEIVILDNSSSDSTAGLAQRFISKFSCVRYIKHPCNIGADKNFLSAFRVARGAYVWIVGDDELLFNGAINYVIGLIRGPDFGCAYLSSEAVKLDFLPNYLGKPCPTNLRCSYFAPWEFAMLINYRLTFLSGTVVNKKALVDGSDNFLGGAENFLGSNLVHLYWVCAAICIKKRSVYVQTPLFASTIANSGGYNPAKVFVHNLGDISVYFFSNLARDPRRSINLLTLLGWFPKVSYDMRFTDKYRSGPQFTLDDFPSDSRHGVEWALLKSIFIAPRPVAFVSVVLMKAAYRIFLLYIRLTKAVKHAA